jgi:flagellar L-ring protein precursor FlgH
MNRFTKIWLIGMVLAGSAVLHPVQSASAQSSSLWQRRDPQLANFVTDVKAVRPGDLLFVTIDEQSDVQNRDQRVMRKQSSSSTDASTTYDVNGDLGSGAGSLEFNGATAGNRQFNGNTQFRSEREFADRFAVTVVDTLPNGNLLISGTRNVSLETDNRTLILTGMVRAVDVKSDNTISSRMVSNLVIRYESDPGPEHTFINQGWLGRKLNRWLPF